MNVIVLTDDKVGSSKQSKALAKLLKFQKHQEVRLRYSFWSKTPNFFPFALHTLDKESRQKVEQIIETDDVIVIAAGRRLARISNYIKQRNPKVKNIQILKPDLPWKNFDVVTLPRHDIKNHDLVFDNLVIFDGAITKHDSMNSKEKEFWAERFKNLPKKKIVLLIGGETKHSVFMEHHARYLARKAIKLATEFDAGLLVSNSRRTGSRLTYLIFQAISKSKVPSFLHDVSSIEPNPYKAFLTYADCFITTGDSISMIAECATTDKPVFIYASEGMVSHKHQKYIKWLFHKEYAYPLQAKWPEGTPHKKKANQLFRDQILEKLGLGE